MRVGGPWRPGTPVEPRRFSSLERRAASGAETGAYMIRAEPSRAKPWYSWPKQQYVMEIVVDGAWRDGRFKRLLESGTTLQAASECLAGYYSWGTFMAYEVTSDLRHTKWLREARDILTWANPGPGARRGLNRIHGRLVKRQQSPYRCLCEMRELLQVASQHLPSTFPALEMRDIEHTLCEFDKYERVRLGEGKPRGRYSGTAAADSQLSLLP